MKIQGPNPLVQLYRNQQRQQHVGKSEYKNDQLNISERAMQLQQKNAQTVERQNYVGELKQLVQSGDYKVNYEATAEKMINFWSNNR